MSGMGETAGVPRVMDLRGTYKGGGGPDKTVLNSAAQHDPRRVNVLVTYLRQPDDHEFQIPEMAKNLGIRYAEVIDGRPLDFSCLKALRKMLFENDIHVVHAHDDKTLFYGWLLRAVTPGLRIMYTCHSHAVYGREAFTSFRSFLGFKIRQRMQIFLMRQYLKPVITVSHETRRRLVANGLPDRDVSVLHNGIDLQAWRREDAKPVLREELNLPSDGFLVGTVARITYDKDLPVFYRVAELVASKVPNVVFVIVGDGYGNELEKAGQEVAHRRLERLIRFTGHRNDLSDVYASFDVFLMTSLSEGMPNTLLEAMAMAVPSVSTSVGGVPELLEHDRCGYLAPVGDVQGLAGYVERLLLDGELRKKFGKACRERVEKHFSFARRVRLMEDYYDWFAGLASMPGLHEGRAGNS